MNDSMQQWITLLQQEQARIGNGILATLSAKRLRPDLYRVAVLGEKPQTTQGELFTSEPSPTGQQPTERGRMRVRGQG